MYRSIRSLWLGTVVIAMLAAVAHAQARVGFDTSGHLLMHGTPRFVLGVYDSGLSSSTDPAWWEQTLFAAGGARQLGGFPLNLYLNYWLGGMPITATNALLDTLQTHGLMYLQTGNCFASGSWLRYGATAFSISSQSYVQQFAQHPAAAGYYIMDECDDALIPETQQHYQQLKSWDPQGISLATNVAAAYRDPSLWNNAADLQAIDPYPLYGAEPSQGYPHFIVGDFTAKLRWVAKPALPVWSVLQFFKFTSDSRLPTAAEMRAHAVMSIVEGAQGIWWWEIGTNGLRALDATTVATWMGYLKALTAELAGLEPALLAAPADTALVGNSTRFADPISGRIGQLQHNIAVDILYSRIQGYQAEIAALQAGDTSKSPLLPGAANVRTRTKIVDGVGYVFAYNYTNLSQPVTFTWQSALTGVKESKSGQSYAVNGASWSDTFGPYEARIYVVNGSTIVSPPPPQPLTVSFTNPTDGATVNGTMTVTMAASGGNGYTYRLAVDGTNVYTGTNASVSWNTTTVTNAQHTLTANVTDASNNTGGASVAVTVSNTTTLTPAVFTASFTYPASGATVNGAQSVGTSTTADWATPKTFTLSVDGTLLTAQTFPTATTFWFTWDTTKVADGSHTLQLAVTMNGQTATATLPVNVGNGTVLPALGASFTSPAEGAILRGNSTTVGMAATGASGPSTFKLAIDGVVVSTQTVAGSTASYTWNTRGLARGPHTLSLTVTDGAGRTATATRTVNR